MAVGCRRLHRNRACRPIGSGMRHLASQSRDRAGSPHAPIGFPCVPARLIHLGRGIATVPINPLSGRGSRKRWWDWSVSGAASVQIRVVFSLPGPRKRNLARGARCGVPGSHRPESRPPRPGEWLPRGIRLHGRGRSRRPRAGARPPRRLQLVGRHC